MEIRSLIHDLNNALTTVLGHAEWLLSPDADRADCERELVAIRNSAQHAAALARELRAWVRKAQLPAPAATLPFPSPPPLRAADPPPLPCGARRILVVDDQAEVRQSVSDMLTALGHVVVTAATATEALQCLMQSAIDVVFTDLSMPDMDGLTLADRVRTVRPSVPVALLTGWGSELEEPNDAVRMVLAKPVTMGSLRDAVYKMAA
ncbi:MAG: response regulator [Acidobacteriota bacterium]